MNLREYKINLIKHIEELEEKKLLHLASLIKQRVDNNQQIFIAGNGGSAATGAHMVCDLMKTILDKDHIKKKRARVINLSDNVPLLTAWSNDSDYEEIFSQPLKNYAQKGDLLIVITGSGNSKNILAALKAARALGITSYALLGFDGGKAYKLADHTILIKSNHYGIVEDTHMIIDHMLTELLKSEKD